MFTIRDMFWWTCACACLLCYFSAGSDAGSVQPLQVFQASDGLVEQEPLNGFYCFGSDAEFRSWLGSHFRTFTVGALWVDAVQLDRINYASHQLVVSKGDWVRSKPRCFRRLGGVLVLFELPRQSPRADPHVGAEDYWVARRSSVVRAVSWMLLVDILVAATILLVFASPWLLAAVRCRWAAPQATPAPTRSG